jgi:hypothetical protein
MDREAKELPPYRNFTITRRYKMGRDTAVKKVIFGVV